MIQLGGGQLLGSKPQELRGIRADLNLEGTDRPQAMGQGQRLLRRGARRGQEQERGEEPPAPRSSIRSGDHRAS